MSTPPEDQGRQSVQAIDRAVAILSVFSRARTVAGVSEIAGLTSLSRSTTHRILASLANHGLVMQLPRSTDYCLGPRLLGLAEAARARLSLEVLAEPAMTALRDTTGETAALHVLDATPLRRTIAQVESLQPLRRTYTDLGAPIPPHEGAPGKVLLAFAEPALREHVLAGDLRTTDTRSKIDAAALRAELDDVRARGFALSLEERLPGVVGVAAPVLDHDGVMVAALSVSVPSLRAGRTELESMAPRVIEGAAELSSHLGHT